MSPEQAQGLADLGVPTDVYALGATLYHLVTGTAPFTGETTLTVLHKHLYEPLPPPRSRNPQVTDACSHLIETMMAKEPTGRYADWRALIADIDRVLQGKAPSVRSLTVAALPYPPSAGPEPRASASGPAAGPEPRASASGPAAVPPAVSRASMARQAQEALARQHQARAPKPALAAAPPTAAKRPSWLTIGSAAAVVVVVALLGALVLRGRGSAAQGGDKRTDGTNGTDGTGATAGTVAAPATRAARAPSRPGAPVPGQAAATPAAPAVPSVPAAAAPPAPSQPWTVPDIGLELVWVAPGSFQMGSNDTTGTERLVHAVRISRGYWMGRYEVTQAEYEALVGKNPSGFKGARNPVETVSWDDAVAFCAKLTEREQKAGRLPDGYEYRLPTEAEWEYAARGGAASMGFTYAGSNSADEVAWYYGNSGDGPLDDSKENATSLSSNNCRAHPVGLKKPNELGLYDVSGNAWEWCLDGFEADYYAKSPGTDPVNLSATAGRVVRGGGWAYIAKCARSASRYDDGRDGAGNLQGFRACLGPAIPVPVESPGAAPTIAESGAPAPTPAAIPSGPAAPLPGPTAAVAVVAPDPAQAKLAALLDQVAADLAAGKPTEALRRWQAGCAVPELKPVAEQVTAIGKTLGEVTSIPQHIAESFQADVGKTVEIELAKEKVTCEVREVMAAGIKVNQIITQGQRTAKLGRTLALGELSLQERLRRLGAGDAPELNLQRGLLALEVGRPDNARRLFEAAGGPLGAALLARLEAQRAAASEAAAEQALSELLRQISGSPTLGDQAKVGAAIRKRCGDDPKRYEDGRRLLAKFEKVWGGKEVGKTWVLVLQEALAYPPRQDWAVPELGLELVWVAPGSFQMGAAGYVGPVHAVQISRGYWLGKYEVTQAEYEQVMGKNPSGFKGARNPVETVSWDDAVEFCAKLTEREQKAGRLPYGYEYRLPTEAEWEYAARGGAKSQATSAGSEQGFTYSGSNNVDEVAWYYSNSGDRRLDDSETDAQKRNSNLSGNKSQTHPVGQKKSNELGLYDLSGNVMEWCLDWQDSSYYARSPGTDPVNLLAATYRVVRSGGWTGGAGGCRSAHRGGNAPGGRGGDAGVRVSLAPAIWAARP
jgi:formylglycine-generating enzyme required for sulfatase activity